MMLTLIRRMVTIEVSVVDIRLVGGGEVFVVSKGVTDEPASESVCPCEIAEIKS